MLVVVWLFNECLFVLLVICNVKYYVYLLMFN